MWGEGSHTHVHDCMKDIFRYKIYNFGTFCRLANLLGIFGGWEILDGFYL